ncbi:MAG: cytochrome c biogenesis protein ResB [Candidatus Nanopelagicales bacterium]
MTDVRDDAVPADEPGAPESPVDTAVDTTVEEAERLSTQPREAGEAVGIGVVGWLRWAWRTLTSMRTALILLFLLAVASVPGSILPQRGTAPVKVTQFIADNPALGRFYDKLSLFDVFAAPWFAAIYLLLFISLAGCVLPRSVQHWRIVRSRPPAAPRNLARLPEHRRLETHHQPQQVLDDAAGWLRGNRWRVDTSAYADGGGWVAAEKGYARETGNLVFHIALLVLLAAVGLGSVGGFRGTVIVREGSSFANTRAQFDSFNPGKAFTDTSMPPFAFTLDDFTAAYQRGGQQNGAARDFSADVTVTREPGAAPEKVRVEVNSPLEVDGVKVFLVGHGYAPKITIRDTKGDVVFRDTVVFLPQDGNFTSTGVVKAPDATPQIGLQGIFLPTATIDPQRGPISTFPAADLPALFLGAYSGDLGLDSGRPQSVYKLDTEKMKLLGRQQLLPGQSWTLPDKSGTVTFDGYAEWASFTVARDPGKELALLASVVAITGLALSLLVRRRRVWVRVARDGEGATVVEVAGLTRSEHTTVADEVDALTSHLAPAAGTPSTADPSTTAPSTTPPGT